MSDQQIEFRDSFKGTFYGILRWEQLDKLWERVREDAGGGWYMYAVGELPPVEVAGAGEILSFVEEELAGLHGMVSQSGALNPRLRDESVKWLESLMPGGGDFATYCLDVWEEEFCSIGFEDIDPRFVGGLIVQLESY